MHARTSPFDPLPRRRAIALSALPFAIAVVAYLVASNLRLEENAYDKLMPSPSAMWAAFRHAAFEVDARTGGILLLHDWLASMGRLAIGVGSAAAVGLMIGLNAALFPAVDRTLMPFVRVASIVPPLALLPILFVTFGVDEVGKAILIFAGLVWAIARDVREHVAALPDEQVTKAQTLGGSPLRIAYGVMLPRAWPMLIASVRLNLGAAWLFLIASEAIAAPDGLGYRIFLVRRYLAMDVILPYVAVITLTGFLIDQALALTGRRLFPWFDDGEHEARS